MKEASRQETSQVERYLLGLTEALNLRVAINRAAYMVRTGHKRMNCLDDEVAEEALEIPIHLDPILKSKDIVVSPMPNTGDETEARLIPREGGFLVQMKAGLPETRKRFVLAHEIGHSIFYEETEGLPRHQISTMNEKDRLSEERLCNRFARALLLPEAHLKRDLIGLEKAPSPWDIVKLICRLSGRYKVSTALLILRMGEINAPAPPLLVLSFRLSENFYKGGDRALRAESVATLGKAKTIWLGRNRTTTGMGLAAVSELFNAWESQSERVSVAEPGQYVLGETGNLSGLAFSGGAGIRGHVNVSMKIQDRWVKEELPVRIASCLLVPSGAAGREDVSIISVVAIDQCDLE